MMKDPKQKLIKWLPALFSPLAVMVLILFNFKKFGLYPFGEATAAWGDMVQQDIPLLGDFMDIFSGKDGLFLNFANAGGMNMWGVFFFFFASPFTFLAVFFEKTELIHFVNILIMLKLMSCGVTASIYFIKRMPKLSGIWVFLLSVAYALSGYGMLYYQNTAWIDIMYIFPLLLLSLEVMLEKQRVIPFTAALACIMTVNYYLGYMIVIFLMLFIGIAVLYLRKDEKYRQAPLHFAIGSALAAMLTAPVWLPSILQYFSSGRVKEDFWQPIKEKTFFTQYATTLPTILHSALLIAVVLVFTLDGRSRTKKQNAYLILAGLLTIPLVIEPVNLLWQTGSYMSHPSRYGFMTLFMLTVCAGLYISDDENRRFPEAKHCDSPLILAGLGILLFYFERFVVGFVEDNFDVMATYVLKLWGNMDSYHTISELFLLTLAFFVLLLVMYRKGLLSRDMLAVVCAVLTGVECWVNCTVYLSSPAVKDPERTPEQASIYDLSDRITDNDGFYRVKTEKKLFYVNLVGPMGYNSLGHYTSLTSGDYMDMMKRLGYSSNWMDVGTYGGTELTDALLSIKYIITPRRGESSSAVYSNERFCIEPLDYYLPMGLVIDDSRCPEADLPDTTRSEMQEYIYEHTVGGEDKLITMYECDDPGSVFTDDKGRKCFEYGDKYTFTVDVRGRQTLYFDCFEAPYVATKGPVDDSFEIWVNGSIARDSYPNGDFNGLFRVGSYEDERVTVRLVPKNDCAIRSFGLFGMDTDKLKNDISNARTAALTQHGGTLTGKYDSDGGESMILSVPYSEEIRVKINGKNTKVYRVFDDMCMIKLESGSNDIKLYAVTSGLTAGLVIFFAGLALCILYHLRLGKKLSKVHFADKAAAVLIIIASASVLAVIYILPLYKNLKAHEK